MPDPNLEKLAAVLVNYCTAVKPGDWVLIRGHVAAMPLIEETLRQVVRAGGNPTVQLESDELSEIMLREGTSDQLSWVAPLDEILAEKLDVRIVISAASNTRAFTAIEPKHQQLYQS